MTTRSDTLIHDRSVLVERTVRRLLWWNRFWILVFILTAAGATIAWGLQKIDDRDLSVYIVGGGLRIFTMGRRPYIVTALYGSGEKTGGAVADLSPPVVLPGDDSGGSDLDAASLRRLKWRNWQTGEPAPPPDVRTIKVLYYQPTVASGERE